MQQQKYPEKCGLLGKLCSGQKKLEGKIFYLDQVKKRCTALLLEAICLLGGKVESFLHKDVNFVVTGNQEGLTEQRSLDSKAGTKVMSEEPQRPVRQRESIFSNDNQRPSATRPMACGSRGKALLEKAIRNNERLQGSSVLANARSWGVKILQAEDVLLYLKRLTRESIGIKQKSEKVHTKQQGSHVVKATALRSPYLKIEDSSRKYKPLHMQSMTFPTMCYLGRFSPFECPPPPQFDKWAEPEKKKNREMSKVENSIEDKSKPLLSPLSCNPSPWKPRKKDLGYCECCQQTYTYQEEHLQSSQHRAFALDSSNYSMVDQLIAAMIPGFDPNPSDQLEEPLNRSSTPVPLQDVCELEPLTDVETEQAVQALRTQHSSFSAHISSPTQGPASPSLGVQCLLINEAAVDVDMQLLTPETDCQFPDVQVHSVSSTMPVLDPKPVDHHSVCEQSDKPPSSCSDIHCLSSDNCFLPPVLSPQVPHMEPHSPYSEPPVLSPQEYPAEEPMEVDFSKMDVPADTLLVSIPVFHFNSVVNAEGEVETDQKKLLGLSQTICLNSTTECHRLGSHRSRSLPRPSTKPSNPKKRCRSASPESRLNKRQRKTYVAGYGNEWFEKSESELMAMIEDFSLFDKISSPVIQSNPKPVSPRICTVQRLGLKQQTSSTFSVACVKDQIDVADQTTWPLHSQASLLATPLQFPNDKCQSMFSSQDSQHCLSHSTSICIESALIPDLATLDPSSSDSDWDSDLLSRLGPASATPASPAEQICELDQELLHRPCTWMHDTSYESRLHTVLQPSTKTVSLCGDEVDPTVFSRTVVQIVEVQH